MAEVQQRCDPTSSGTTISDDGRSMVIDGIGDADPAGLDIEAIACLLGALGAPEATIQQMGLTAAQDGWQTDTWADLHAAWTHNTIEGLDIIVTTNR